MTLLQEHGTVFAPYSKSDLELIEQAKQLDCIDWYKIDFMILKAISQEAIVLLKSIRRSLYLKEEYDSFGGN